MSRPVASVEHLPEASAYVALPGLASRGSSVETINPHTWLCAPLSSRCSTALSLSTGFSQQLLEPLFKKKQAERCLTAVGAPPRLARPSTTCDALATAGTIDKAMFDSQFTKSSDSDKCSMFTLNLPTSAVPRGQALASNRVRKMRLRQAAKAGNAPSLPPRALLKTFEPESALPAEEKAELALHRADCYKAGGEECRRQAARWRERHERFQQIKELQWILKDDRGRRAFAVDSLGRARAPTPTAVFTFVDEVASDHGKIESEEEPAEGEERGEPQPKTTTAKPRRPLQARLRAIRRRTHRRYRKADEASLCPTPTPGAAGSSAAPAHAGGAYGASTSASSSAARTKPLVPEALPQVVFAGTNGVQPPDAQTASRSSTPPAGTRSLISRQNTRLRETHLGHSAKKFADKEKTDLLSIFAKHDGDRSETLDHGEMLACLRDLGLRWLTEKERLAVRAIIWELDELQVSFQEFSIRVVPAVQKAYAALRRPRLQALFKEVDAYGKGYVSVEETLEALRKIGTFASNNVCKEALYAFSRQRGRGDRVPTGFKKAVLDSAGFAMFVEILQERTERDAVIQFQRLAARYGLGAEDRESWKHDLVNLHGMFHEHDPCSGKYGSSSGYLNEQEVIRVIRESGYMPKTRQKQLALNMMIKDLMRIDGTIGFVEFLRIMHVLREFDRERIRRAFDLRYGRTKTALEYRDVYMLLEDCGVTLRTGDEKAECEALIEDIDEEGSGRIGKTEFVVLCQRMAAHLRVLQRERERQYILAAGWTEQNFGEFHSTFQAFDEDMSEVLERDELMKAVELLKGQYWQSSGNMNLMLESLGIDPSKEIKVNFLMFLKMLKMLDESETRRQQGALMNFSRDRTDYFYSIFQALEPDSMAGLRRETLEKALAVACRHFKGGQPQECKNLLQTEPMQVEFAGFLRIVKGLESIIESEFEEFLRDVRRWEDILQAEQGKEVVNAIQKSVQNSVPVNMGSFESAEAGGGATGAAAAREDAQAGAYAASDAGAAGDESPYAIAGDGSTLL